MNKPSDANDRPNDDDYSAHSAGDDAELGSGRQTRTFLMEKLQANGLAPKRQLGQNFLIDLNLLSLIEESAQLKKSDVVLEVGAGTGGLTSRLAQAAGRVISVEIDHGLFALAQYETREFDNVTLLRTDALARKNQMSDEVMAEVKKAMHDLGANDFHLVANLPYDVASSVIANLLLNKEPAVRRLTFTVQWEVADRLASRPGRRAYGPLSILVQLMGRYWWIRTVPPHAFWPRPKIKSAILQIQVNPNRWKEHPHLLEMHRFARDLFVHRRKNIRGSITSIPTYKKYKPKLEEVLKSVGLKITDRAEDQSPQKLYDLYVALQEMLESPPPEKGASAE